MAELPRLNGVVGALEKGRHALTTFTPADVEAAIALATAKYDAGLRDGAQCLRHPRLPRLPAIHAQQTPDRASGIACSGGRAVCANSTERRGESAIPRQAGARSRRLWNYLAAYQHRRPGLQCGGGVPLSAPEEQAAL